MIRVVLAVAVAAALLAASLPAIEAARADRTAGGMERFRDRIVAAGESLLASDAAGAGARRVVDLVVPAGSMTRAGVTRLSLACRRECRLVYRLDGGRRERHPLGNLPLSTPAGPVEFARPGSHRIVLRLVDDGGRRVVAITR